MIAHPFSLENKTILLTGASSGIGKATAIAISQLGGKLIITGRDETRLEETYQALQGTGHKKIIADFLGANPVDTIVSQIEGPINGIVHSAGIPKTLPFKFSTPEMLQEIMKVNFEVPFILTQKLIKNRLVLNGSSIVFVSSVSGAGTVAPGISMYSATKGAINATIKVIALELAKNKIRVNSVSPGMVRTNLNTANPNLTAEDLKKDEMNTYPLGYGEPEDVAYGIIYFLSDASRWVTGTTLIMDGGATIH